MSVSAVNNSELSIYSMYTFCLAVIVSRSIFMLDGVMHTTHACESLIDR